MPVRKKTAADAAFERRLEHRMDEMKWLYMELYDDQAAFDKFLNMLREYRAERKPLLRVLDEERLKDPDWYRGNDMLGTLLYADAFAGTLKGVREHLTYLEECGVNYVHLMPLLMSPKGRSDGGYAVADFRKVQPELGTMKDLEKLSDSCHARGMSVCLDFVMNHTSEDHEWAVRAKAGEKEYQDRYFFYDDRTIPDIFEQTVPQVFPQTAPGNFSWCPEAGKYVMTTFYPYQWDLNYANPDVFREMTANMLFLLNRGVDIIRLDAVPYIWKELGTNCRNLPRVHTLVRIMRMAVEAVCPGALLLGEVVMEPSKVVPYFGTVEKPECHMLYNVTTMASTWHTVAVKDVRLLRHQLDTVFSLPGSCTFLNYLRCHDDIGWGLDYAFLREYGMEEAPHKKYLNDYFKGAWPGTESRGELYNDDPRLQDARLCGTTASLCGIEAALEEGNAGKLDSAVRLDVMLHAFLLTQSGIPVLYAGDEIGQLNDRSYHDDPLKADDSRYLHRGRMNWDDAAKRAVPDSLQGRIFSSLRRLEKLRASRCVFNSRADCWTLDAGDDRILAVGRYYNGEKLIALFNFGDEDLTARIGEPEEYTDLLTGETLGPNEFFVRAHDFRWLLHDFRDPGKLIFLDIDGTLTEPGSNEPPESALRAIRAAQEKGHRVFLCSGRNPAMLSPLLKYGFDGYIACAGGFIMVGDEVIYDHPMTDKQTKTALKLLHGEGVFCTVEARDASYGDDDLEEFLKGQGTGNSEIERWRRALAGKLNILPMKEYDGRPAYKIVIMCLDRSQLDPAEKKLGKDFDFCVQEVSAHSCLNGELINRAFNKGLGVRMVAEKLGVPLSRTIGFGDSMNDLEMIETVGLGVCMGNGSEALKAKSAMVCPPVAQDGLAEAFGTLGLA